MLPRFVANEDAEDNDTSSRHRMTLPFESATPSPEAMGRSADAQRPAGPLADLPVLVLVTSLTPGRGKCRTTLLRGGGDVSPAA